MEQEPRRVGRTPGTWRRTAWARVLPALAAVAADLPFLPRSFTSEDFLLLRFLREHPPWGDWWGAFFAPWLGITAVGFYRPISTLGFALEGALFAGDSLPYNGVHLAVHAANAVLLAAIARRLGAREWEAGVAAALFAIYPLHPNAVLFLGSFATLFGAHYFLLSLWAFLAFARGGSPWQAVASVASFLLALGSYEASVVLPLWAAGAVLLRPPAGDRSRRRAGIAVGVLAVVAALYLGWRWALFRGLGGYADLAAGWSAESLAAPALGALRSLRLLVAPSFAGGQGHLGTDIAALALMGTVAWVLLRSGGEGDRRWNRRVLGLSFLWVLAALAPFSFRPVVPGTGRYWYLAAAALSLGLGLALCRVAAFAGPLRWGGRALLLGLAIGWSALRLEVGASYGEAGRTVRRVRDSLAAAVRGRDGPCLVAGVPPFVERHGVPYAQVFHYGLSDSLRPPFSPVSPVPVVMPVLGAARDLALLRDAPDCRLAWRADSQSFASIAPAGPAGPLAVAVSADSRWVRLRPAAGLSYRLVVAAPGNSTLVPFTPAPRQGIQRAAMPSEFLQTMNRLYGPQFAWWVEGRDAAGDLVAVSTYRPGGSAPIS